MTMSSNDDDPAPLTHLSTRGEAWMVDVGQKSITARRAVARARVQMSAPTFARLAAGTTPKGDVLATARIAGIQAAKRTSELIPLCHVIGLTHAEVTIHLVGGEALVCATVEAQDRTGVEMEAMTAASVAALTLYDMLKAIDRSMSFTVELEEKSGGRSGTWRREREEATVESRDEPTVERAREGEAERRR